MKKKQPKIFISIPCYDGKISVHFLAAFRAWVRQYDTKLHVALHISPLDSARNLAIHDFLKEKQYTHFLGVDADMSPSRNSLTRLLEADKDCISPLMFTCKPDRNLKDTKRACAIPMPILYTRNKEGKLSFIRVAKGITKVDLLPGGMYLLKRRVLEKIKLPAFKYEYTKDGWTCGGSDEGFSKKAQAAGFDLFVHAGVLCEQIVDIGAGAFNATMLRYCRSKPKIGQE